MTRLHLILRCALLSVAALGAVIALPASAGAVTFGSDLSARSSNSNVTCGDFNIFQYAGRLGCSVYTTGNAANPGDTSAIHVIPFPDPRVHGDQHGRITRVSFKPAPGAPPGPARLSVVEFIRDADSTGDPGLAQDIADSANFVMSPGADGLVHVITDLPARSLYNSDDNSYRFDVLVLSMLDNTTPIPADLTSSFLSAWINPYVDIPSTNGELTVPLPLERQGTGCCGFGPHPFYALGAWDRLGEVLMQAELTMGRTDNRRADPVRIGNPRLRGGSLVLPLACALDRACRGVLRLLGPAIGRASSSQSDRSARRVVVGGTRFAIPSRSKRRAGVRLTRNGKRLVRRAMRTGRPVRLIARAKVSSQVTATPVRLSPRRGRR